jgi:hypothetical protein
MTLSQSTRHSRLSIVRWIVLFFAVCEGLVMPDIVAANPKSIADVGFAISGMGGHQYGTNGVGVWLSGKVRIGLSDTINEDFSGVGVIESQLSREDLREAKDVYVQLCKAAEEIPITDMERIEPPTVYSVTCLSNDRETLYRGRLDELPRDLCFRIDGFYKTIRNAYLSKGSAIVKLDVQVASVTRQNEKFLVAVKFVNSGQYPLVTFPPDLWKNRWGDQLLNVGGKRTDGNDTWSASLAGLPLMNKSEFPDETITIPAKGSVTFTFLTMPDGKVPAGTYDLHVQTFMDIGGDGPAGTIGKADFHSDTSKPKRVTFEHDYPSTPQEWKDYEAQHRAKMSSFPAKPGEAFPEDGYYRLVSNSGQRSRFVFAFRKDAIAPKRDDVQDEDGKVLYGMLHWQWEADNALYDFCKVGDPCPRGGRWISGESDPIGNKLNKVNSRDLRRFVAGELMPDFQGGGRYHYTWYWLGV